MAQNLFGKLPHDIRFSTDPNHKLTDLSGILAHLKRYAEGLERCDVGSSLGGSSDSLARRPTFELTLLPRGGTETQRATPFCLYAVGVETIPVSAPRVLDGDWLNEMKALNLVLAEEAYESGVPGPIDIIIGAGQYNLALHQREMIKLANGVTATNSVFGWVLTGEWAKHRNDLEKQLPCSSISVRETSTSKSPKTCGKHGIYSRLPSCQAWKSQ